MAATEQVMIVLKAKDEASRVIDNVTQSANGMSKAFKLATGAMAAASAAAVAGITATIATGVSKAAQLEQGVADIASVMGVAASEAQPLKDLITNLGIDPNLKVNAEEASDAIMQLAQSGMSMQEIIDGAARSTVLLSNATGGDMATSAAIASDAMALFNISAADMQRAVNGITGVTVASKFGINDYQLALSQAGGVASAVGVGFEDFNATIAAISPYFASGSDAGTSFKTFLQRLVPQSNDATSAMMALGLITEDGANQFFDASGSMRSMGEIAGLLQGALSGLTEEQKTAALSTIFGTDAMRAAVGLAETGSGKFDELAASIGKIDAEASAATRMDTLSGAMEVFQGMIDGLLTQIGDAFLPIARKFTDWAIELADQHGPALVAWFGNLADAIPPIVNQVQAWSGVIIAAVGEIMAWLGGKKTDFNNLQTMWASIAGLINNAITSAVNYVQAKWPEWVATLQSWGNLFASWAGTLWSNSIQPGLASMWGNLSAWLDLHADGLGTKLGTWGAAFAGIVAGIIAGWQEAWPKIEGFVNSARISIGQDVDQIVASLDKIAGWFAGGEGDNAINAWSTFFTSIAWVATETLKNLTGVIASIVDVVAQLGELFKALQIQDWGTAGGIAADIAQKYAALLTAPFTMPLDAAMQGWNALQGRAMGGPVTGGTPYMVGENGPELFVPERSGQIVPNVTNDNSRTVSIGNVNLQGSNSAAEDVLSSIQLLTMLYA